MLLGIDFLKDNNCTLNFEKQTIDSDHGIPVVNLLSTKPCAITGLARPMKHTIIQPHSEMLIPIRISRIAHQQTSLFEPTNLLIRNKLAGAKTILNINKGRGFCRVLNPLSSPVTQRPSHVIGTLCPIDTNTIIELDLEKNDAYPSVNSAACSDKASDKDEASKFKEYKEVVSELGISLEESDLSEEQKLRLYVFIAINRSSFAKDTSELGCTNVH